MGDFGSPYSTTKRSPGSPGSPVIYWKGYTPASSTTKRRRFSNSYLSPVKGFYLNEGEETPRESEEQTEQVNHFIGLVEELRNLFKSKEEKINNRLKGIDREIDINNKKKEEKRNRIEKIGTQIEQEYTTLSKILRDRKESIKLKTHKETEENFADNYNKQAANLDGLYKERDGLYEAIRQIQDESSKLVKQEAELYEQLGDLDSKESPHRGGTRRSRRATRHQGRRNTRKNRN